MYTRICGFSTWMLPPRMGRRMLTCIRVYVVEYLDVAAWDGEEDVMDVAALDMWWSTWILPHWISLGDGGGTVGVRVCVDVFAYMYICTYAPGCCRMGWGGGCHGCLRL
jgi:hypothetical protein